MLEKNKKVGDYILVERLGSGGFGEVWKAEKRTALSISYFALKFFRPNEDEKIDLKSVRKEVETWQTLTGLPNVISVIEANIFENYVYIVSDFAEGGSLESWIKENGGKTNSVEEAVKITRQILHGLEGMHRAGFVHRDLKPANILIKKGVVYLADFGLSRAMTSNSQATSAVGTIGFMPPEAFSKKPTVSIHTDIWATGVILQKLLTGEMPFPQDEIPSLITSILMGEPEPLPESVPKEFHTIIKKALQKKREDRFQWAREMNDALRDALVPKSIQEVQNPKPNLERTVKLEIGATQPNPEPTKEAETKQNEQTLKLPENKSQLTIAGQIQPQPAHINKLRREVVKIPSTTPIRNLPAKNNAGFGLNKKIGLGAAALVLVGVIAVVGYNWNGLSLMGIGNSNKTLENNAVKKNLTATPSNLPNAFKNQIGMEFVKIPPGKFLMGSPEDEWQRDKNESPQHEVIIDYEFYLGKYEVTQEEYQKVTGTNPSNFKDCPRCPVELISWNDAKDFIAKLNGQNDGYEYRLPSEAEWEYAARGGTTTLVGVGDGTDLSSAQANFDGNHPLRNAPKGKYLQRTNIVGSYQPNAFGLYDMHGNVWEWCEDIYQNTYEGLSVDGSPNEKPNELNLRVVRGGGWVNVGAGMRSAVRSGSLPTNRLNFNGLRVVAKLR